MIDMDKIFNSNIQIIEIQKGSPLNQEPIKNKGDEMSEAIVLTPKSWTN